MVDLRLQSGLVQANAVLPHVIHYFVTITSILIYAEKSLAARAGAPPWLKKGACSDPVEFVA